MKTSILLPFSLLLCGLLSLFYVAVDTHLNGPSVYIEQLAQVQSQLQQEQLKSTLADYRLQEFKMEVARVLPKVLKEAPRGEAGYPLRSLASVVLKGSAENVQAGLSDRLFIEAKALFRDSEYRQANQKLRTFLRRYPASAHVPEAYFLLAEGLFQVQEYDEFVKTSEALVKLYPESELTGFTLLRMGKVFEWQDRPEEAIGIYKTVLISFPYDRVARQAKLSLQAVEL